MQVYTVDDIRRLKPCFDPVTGLNGDGLQKRSKGLLTPDWRGTLLDIVAIDDASPADRFWVVFGLLNGTDARLLACRLVRRTPLADGRVVGDLLGDERSRVAIETAERFALGEASVAQINAARHGAWAAHSDLRADVMLFVATGAAAHTTSDIASLDVARGAAICAAGYFYVSGAWLAAPNDSIAWLTGVGLAEQAQLEITRAFLVERA